MKHINALILLTSLLSFACGGRIGDPPERETVSECEVSEGSVVAATSLYRDGAREWRSAEVCEANCEVIDGFAGCIDAP